MDVLEIIDMLEDAVDKAAGIPFVGKAIIDREEFFDLLDELRLNLPDDLKHAKWVKEERARILEDANKESESIIKMAEEKMASMIDDHEITQKAYAKANEIVEAAQTNAKEIRQGTKQYIDENMAALEMKIEKVLETIRQNRRELKK